MNKRIISNLTLVSLLAASAFAGDYTKYVNPFIGTGPIEGGLSGNNYPGATVPFGMVQLSPDTHEAPDWFNASGYDHNDSRIYGFSHTRLSGTGACDLIDILLMPTTSDKRVSAFSHEREKAQPGYYKVHLDDENIDAELTATQRTGIHRYTFPSGSSRNLWLDLDHSAQKGSWDRRIINSQIKQIGPKIYFVAEFSEPIKDLTLFDGDERRYENGDSKVINGKALRSLISFGNGDKPVTVRVGISPVSLENAKENLLAEAPDMNFDKYVAEADKAWDERLGKIEVKGDPEKMTTFYTALYHTMIQPNLFSDVNGEWITPDYSVAKVPAGENQYTTFSLWDTYRAAHPLYTIIEPEVTKDFVNSMLRHYDYYGYLPIWHLWGQDNYCMIGNHAIPVVVDAVEKGIPGIDRAKAWEAVKNSSTQSHPNSPFSVWEKHGYMPEDVQTQSVSITLEMAYDDWCAAQLARMAGDAEAERRFTERSQYFRNLYNPANGFFAPKNEKGEWMEPFDPLKYGANGGNPFTEGNAWQYFWYVPHDVEGLIELTGGKKAFEKKLDTFFTLTETSGAKNDNISGLIGQYAHGNEPSHHVAYLYNYAGRPDKTARLVNYIMNSLYNNNFNGYAGNDDCGEMSAWYVFSALGFYPVNPASGEYNIGTPLFDEAIIHLPSGKDFRITADRKKPKAVNVKKMKLNDKAHKAYTISHSDLINGGELHFDLD